MPYRNDRLEGAVQLVDVGQDVLEALRSPFVSLFSLSSLYSFLLLNIFRKYPQRFTAGAIHLHISIDVDTQIYIGIYISHRHRKEVAVLPVYKGGFAKRTTAMSARYASRCCSKYVFSRADDDDAIADRGLFVDISLNLLSSLSSLLFSSLLLL